MMGSSDWIASLRRLRRKPLYTTTVAIALGLGIGAATVVFSWFEALFLRPLPGVRESASLQIFELQRADYSATAFSHPDYLDLAEGLKSSMDLAGYSLSRVALSGAGKPEEHWALYVSGNFFSTLDIKPVRGRLVNASDTAAEPVAVLGYDWWQKRFGADPAILGRTIYLNRQAVRIAGITPPEFRGPYTGLSIGLYVPVAASDSIEAGAPRLSNRRPEWLTLLARLHPGVSREQASAAARLTASRLERVYPNGAFHETRLSLTPLWRSSAGAQAVMGPVIFALGGIVAAVLLLSYTNAAGLMLLENAGRAKDMAIRVALGAGSGGLIRYCLAEALPIAGLAAGVGLLIAQLAAGNLQSMVPEIQFPVKLDFPLDGPVLAFSALAAVLAAIFCGMWSAFEARRKSTAVQLRSEGRAVSASRDRSRLRGVFVTGQIALTFLLLSCAALFYGSVDRARQLDLGFDPRFVSLVRVDLTGNRYAPTNGSALLSNLLQRVRGVPGVESASLATSVPLGFGDQELMSIIPEGASVKRNVWGNRIAPGYFETMGIELVAGRDFSMSDSAGASRAAIVNEALARKLWNGISPLGRSFAQGPNHYAVVGVVRNTKIWSLDQESQPYLYLPLWQAYAADVSVHVKSKQPPATIHRLVTQELERLDPALPVVSTTTLGQQVDAAVFPQRIAVAMLGTFALLGIYLATIGLYGVIAHAARSRSKEIAIRMALGATAMEVLRLVLKQALLLVAAGLCAGVALSLIAGRMLDSMLIGSGARDLRGLALAAAGIAFVGIAATCAPALRAVRTDAAAALRAD